MARANRIFDHHHVWHLTHRCHKKEYLLKFARDRQLWCHWLFKARRRYGLSVLNYIVTSNHIHMLVASGDKRTIPQSMALIAGRTAQSYNRRKGRRGAFWEDRYHAVPIRSQAHFKECLVYVDLNMVRAGVVAHPREWVHSGYNAIQKRRKRYVILDYDRLVGLTNASSLQAFQKTHRQWVDEKLRSGDLARDERWTNPDAAAIALATVFSNETET